MKEATPKERLLKKVRAALITKENPFDSNIDWDSEIYKKSKNSLEETFAEELTKVKGNFIFCTDQSDFITNFKELIRSEELKHLICLENKLSELLAASSINHFDDISAIEDSRVSITNCEALIARLGSVMVSSKQLAGRRLFSFAKTHIVVAYTSQLVYDIKDGLDVIKEKYGAKMPSMITNITGPSRTADIEKTLIIGAHGPAEIYVFLIDDHVE